MPCEQWALSTEYRAKHTKKYYTHIFSQTKQVKQKRKVVLRWKGIDRKRVIVSSMYGACTKIIQTRKSSQAKPSQQQRFASDDATLDASNISSVSCCERIWAKNANNTSLTRRDEVSFTSHQHTLSSSLMIICSPEMNLLWLWAEMWWILLLYME